MKRLFAPGCGLMLYKPELAANASEYLMDQNRIDGEHHICCRHEPMNVGSVELINSIS